MKYFTAILLISFACIGNSQSAAKFGDLQESEIEKIQDVVDASGFDLLVVGSATLGKRRNPGTNLPFGKGEGTKSDIDYTFPIPEYSLPIPVMAFLESHQEIYGKLPELSPHGVLHGPPNTESPRIWFRPGKPPAYLPAGARNLEIPVWTFAGAEIQNLTRELIAIGHKLQNLRDPKLEKRQGEIVTKLWRITPGTAYYQPGEACEARLQRAAVEAQ